MADLPTVSTEVPTVSAPRGGAIPEPRVYQPRLEQPKYEALLVQDTTSPWREIAKGLETASSEANDVAKIMAREAGLKSVVRDADGNVAIDKFPIVGDAALSFKRAMETAAITDGEDVAKRDLVDMQHKFRDDPEGFRSAAQAYRQEKVGQYEKVAGAAVGLSLGHAIDSTATETYRGLLNRQEALELKRASASIDMQLQTNSNELYAIANGGDTTSPAFTSRIAKQAALWEELASNPRLGIPRDRIDFEMRKLDSELKVAQLDFHLKTVQKEQGVDAAMAQAEEVKTNPALNLSPGERLNYYSRLVGGIKQRVNDQNRIDTGIANEIKSIGDIAAQGFDVPAARTATVKGSIAESANPALGQMMKDVETVQPIIASWRKLSPAELEANLAANDRNMREHGATTDQLMLRDVGDKLLTNMRKALKDDPLGWANRVGSTPVPTINFGAPDVVDQVRDRVSRAESAAKNDGVTPTYLKPDEVALLTAESAKGGSAMLGVANTIVQGAGDKATRVLSEVGKDAPVLAHVGSLMAVGGSPAFIRDAADAVALRQNKDFKHPTWLSKESDVIQAAQHNRTVEVFGNAFMLAPTTGRQAEMTAQDAFFTRSARNSYDPKLEGATWSGSKAAFDRSLQESAGATFVNNVQYGGVTPYGTKPGTWFTSDRVLVPTNVRADKFKDVIGAVQASDLVPSNLAAADAALKLTPQEKALYQRHLTNLTGPGGVTNPDGSRSTLFQVSFEQDGKTYNVPTVYDGKILKPEDAIARAQKEGLNNFPSYGSQAAAENRYQQMHGFMERDTAQFMRSPPPVDARGQPYKPAQLQSAIPVAVSGGYRFALGDPTSDDPKWIRGANGQPFVLDLQRLEPALRQRVPQAYSGGGVGPRSSLGDDVLGAVSKFASALNPIGSASAAEGALPEGSPLRPKDEAVPFTPLGGLLRWIAPRNPQETEEDRARQGKSLTGNTLGAISPRPRPDDAGR